MGVYLALVFIFGLFLFFIYLERRLMLVPVFLNPDRSTRKLPTKEDYIKAYRKNTNFEGRHKDYASQSGGGDIYEVPNRD